ncbi:hypothetical protein EVAR_62287_1 [Eumeta japonica]|uniref:Uncharacterized protein n=1 Tax=Eumeta variegata TaxID=151549 RepID=A0A4C1ZXY7_EUMVA|nr:hypothetical protein EVAR_62287_1 [Eumeta japonica]
MSVYKKLWYTKACFDSDSGTDDKSLNKLFKNTDLENLKGHNINAEGEYITYVQFAGDVRLTTDTPTGVGAVAASLGWISQRVAQEMNAKVWRITKISTSHRPPTSRRFRPTARRSSDKSDIGSHVGNPTPPDRRPHSPPRPSG